MQVLHSLSNHRIFYHKNYNTKQVITISIDLHFERMSVVQNARESRGGQRVKQYSAQTPCNYLPTKIFPANSVTEEAVLIFAWLARFTRNRLRGRPLLGQSRGRFIYTVNAT